MSFFPETSAAPGIERRKTVARVRGISIEDVQDWMVRREDRKALRQWMDRQDAVPPGTADAFADLLERDRDRDERELRAAASAG